MASNDASLLASACPTSEVLLAYSLGKLPSDQLETVASHLCICQACLKALEAQHASGDALVAKLRLLVGQEDNAQAPVTANALLADSTTANFQTPIGTPTAEMKSAAFAADGAAAQPSFGSYVLLEKLGRGGMGIVYKARQIPLDRFVALKMILAGAYASQEERARFQLEGRAIARLQHPQIVQIYEFGECDDRPYFAMELLEGGSLHQQCHGKQLAERDAAQIVRLLALAVQAAHEQNIVHRDLKPSNILFTKDAVPKIVDFGLAKLLDAESTQTLAEVILGTPSYMAPEQTLGDSTKIGPNVDIHALGTILYELLTGRPPFQRPTREETLEQVRTRPAEPIRKCRAKVARDLEAVCLKCLEKEPVRRYRSAAALAQDLERWLQGKATYARPDRWYEGIWRSMRRRPLLHGAAAILSLATILLIVAWLVNDPDRPVREIEERLADNEGVVLIPDTGAPRWWRIRMGDEITRIRPNSEGLFTVQSGSLSLVELVRQVKMERFRFRADIRQDDGESMAEVGLYVAYQQRRLGNNPLHSFLHLAYDDIGDIAEDFKRNRAPPPPGNPVFFEPWFVMELAGKPHVEVKNEGCTKHLFKPAGFRGGIWRTIALEVTPASIRGVWNQQIVGDLSAAKFEDNGRKNLCNMQQKWQDDSLRNEPSTLFPPGGGLGLFVRKGIAAFRNVVIEVLD